MAQHEGYERLLRLAAYVKARRHHGCTISEIAVDVPGYGDLSQSALEKALQRDITTLNGQGILIKWSHDSQRYELEPPYFTSEERRVLIAAASTVEVTGISENLGHGELGTAVTLDLARVVVEVHPRVVELRDAIAARRAISFTYQGNRGDPALRRVDPFGVGLWRTRWYLVGYDHDRSGIRKFELGKIVVRDDADAITKAGEPNAYEIPLDFDPVAALEMDPNAWGGDTPIRARVQVNHDQLPRFLNEFAVTIIEDAAESSTFDIDVRDYESFIIRLLGFGRSVRLLGPPALVDQMRAWLAPREES